MRVLGALVIAALACTGAVRQPHVPRAQTIHALTTALVDGYVYDTTGRRIADTLNAALQAGRFDNLDDVAFADSVRVILNRISRDKHLGIEYRGPARQRERTPPVADDRAPPEAQPPAAATGFDPRDHGFERAEIMSGNIGYIDLHGFGSAPELLAHADSVMASFAKVSALIIDLRANTGGSPELVRLLSTYLFDRPTHLVTSFMRGMPAPRERWTLDSVAGERLRVPVYILTSRRTLSAAESFIFGLKINNRVTIVGERTAGAGHFGSFVDLPGGFVSFVPHGRTYDPRTNEGWEAEGIEPHVLVPAADALDTALRLIRGGT